MGPWEKYQKKDSSGESGPWNKFSSASPTEPENKTTASQAALEGFGQGATLGYLPQLQAMTEPLTDRIGNLMPGPDAEPAPWSQMKPGSPEYIQARDRNIQRQQQQATEHPGAALSGQAAGVIATSLVPGKLVAQGVKTAGKAMSAAKGAATGAVEAGLMNPGDTEGEFNPLQMKERVENAKWGAGFGAGGGLAAKGVSSVVSKSKDIGEKLAFKASGAMLKDFRSAADKGKINDLGRFMLDKVLKAGDSYDDVARKADLIKDEAGKEIGKVYSDVMTQVGDQKFWNGLDPAKKSALAQTGFKPAAQKAEIIKAVDEALGDSPNKKAAMSFIEGYLDELGTKYGNDLDIVSANKIKGTVDKAINYGKRAQDLPEKQEALFALRNFIRDRTEDHIGVLDDIVGGQKVKNLRAANKMFGAASEIEGIAADRVLREDSNRFFSLGDRVTGAAGVAGGAASGAILGGDIESAVKGAALGMGGAALSKTARKYGPQAAAKAFDVASKATGAAVVPAAAASVSSKIANDPEYKKGDPKKEIEIEKLAEPLKGSEKWANDGYEKLKEQGLKDLDKDALLNNPKAKKLLIAASDLKPGSKAMNNIVSELEKLKGKR